jgi:nucleoside 2-deoxyribosyltransferase
MSATLRSPRAYLAGPTVFLPDPEAEYTVMRELCAQAGLTGIAPLDGQLDLSGHAPGLQTSTAIVRADVALMDAADGALICLDSFRRSPEMDPGTAVEIGYLLARQVPMCGWTRDPRRYPERVVDYFGKRALQVRTGGRGAGVESGSMRDPDGILVHSEGCFQNAMAHVGIELSGGEIFADPQWQVAFLHAARALARVLKV